MLRRRILLPLIAGVTLAACQDATVAPDGTDAPELARSSAAEDAIRAVGDEINARLDESGAEYRVGMVEWITAPGSGDGIGRTVFFNNVGNKQLAADFVPFDARRVWSGPVTGPTDDITYAVDQVDAAIDGLTAAQTTAAIDGAMATWDGEQCSELPITKNDDFGLDLGFLAGSPFVVADVTHAGWGDADFGGGTIGATFTLVYCAPCMPTPVFTDIDSNGKLDVAFREIYYDPAQGVGGPAWPWTTDGTGIDVETVALHEAGHGLSQGHFGKLFRTDKNGKFHFAPRAVMNAGYTGVQQSPRETDSAGHCSNWGSWPNN